MKNFSLVLNIVLLAAVGFLFYRSFYGESGKKTTVTDAVVAKKQDTVKHVFNMAYVDFDSLNSRITYLKQHRKDIDQEQKNIESEAENAYKKLDDKQKDFVQKNPNATPEQIQKIRTELMENQQDIETTKQTRLQQLNQKSFTLLEDVKSKLRNFIADYNKDKKYEYILMTGTGLDYLIYKDTALNITDDVIKGLNEKLKAKQ